MIAVAGLMMAASMSGAASPVFGWSCKSIDSKPVDLRATVFRMELDLYQLRVVAVQGEEGGPIYYPLLRLQEVRASSDQDRLFYRGSSGSARAELAIREIPGEIHLPATLRLARERTEPGDPLGPVSETAMVCTPTRNAGP